MTCRPKLPTAREENLSPSSHHCLQYSATAIFDVRVFNSPLVFAQVLV
jgi:hypothetical protein